MLERFHVPSADEVRISEVALRTTVTAIFEALGVPPEDSSEGADVLVMTDLRGVESHGVSNTLRWYVERFRSGEYNPRPQPKVVSERASAATIDGDGGLGILLGTRAMRLAIDKARETGVGVVTMRNAGHLGAVGHFALQAARQDMVGSCFTAMSTLVLPTFGALPRLGTNPISIAAPARRMPWLLFDAATSSVAYNKIHLARRVGAPLEPGWVAADDGVPIMEPTLAPPDRHLHLLPLGGNREQGSHKGYGLALMVETLTTLLAGALPDMVTDEKSLSRHHFAAYDIAAFGDLEQFKDTMDAMLTTLIETPPAPGEERVIYPGLAEWETERERRANGIPLHREVIDWFDHATQELGIAQLAR